MEYLQRFGTFDEVSLGGSWSNSWFVRHAAADTGAGVPAVYLLRYSLVPRDGDAESLLFVETELEVVAVRVGVESIVAWAESGTGLP
jgi:hypothetical protein